MNKIFIKAFLFWIVAIWFAQNAYAQDYCYNCNADSLVRTLQYAKTDSEKIRLLTLLIDLKVFDVGSGESTKNDSILRNYVQSLLILSKSQKVKDVDAYKSLSDALNLLAKKDYLGAQNSFKKSIALFEKNHKKMPHLIAAVRYTYNAAGNQEERFKFYTEKLHYYLIKYNEERL